MVPNYRCRNVINNKKGPFLLRTTQIGGSLRLVVLDAKTHVDYLGLRVLDLGRRSRFQVWGSRIGASRSGFGSCGLGGWGGGYRGSVSIGMHKKLSLLLRVCKLVQKFLHPEHHVIIVHDMILRGSCKVRDYATRAQNLHVGLSPGRLLAANVADGKNKLSRQRRPVGKKQLRLIMNSKP